MRQLVPSFQKILSRTVNEFSSKVFLRDNKTAISYSQLPSILHNINSIMIESGIRRGDIAGICISKGPLLSLAYMTCFYAGYIALPISTSRTSAFLKDLNIPVKIIISDRDIKEGSVNISRLNILRKSADSLPEEGVNPEETVYFNITSGTTSRPKVARCSFSSIYHNTKSVIDHFRFNHNDSHICMFPSHLHPHEFFIRALMTGGSAFIKENLLPRDIPEVLEKNRISALMATPTIQKAMIRFSRACRNAYRYTRLFEAGGMITDISIRKEFPERTGRDITPVWGSTETLGVALVLDPAEPFIPNLIGSPIRGYEAKLKPVDDDPDEGIMVIKGRGTMTGYYMGEDIHSGFDTGDIVKNQDNRIIFLGRSDNMIKKGGMRIYPEELSARIRKLDFIKDSAIITVDHPLYGKDIVLFLELEKELRIKDIKRKLIETLEEHELPHSIRILKEMPYYASGKIDYKALRLLI